MGDVKEQSTVGKVISCKAAVCWGTGQDLVIEQIDVAPPRTGEVRIRITHTTICQTDVFILRAPGFNDLFPRILGHEGSGIVESVGDGVTDLMPGDHVLPLLIGECKNCVCCKSPKTNACSNCKADVFRGTMMSDNTSRFSLNGKPVYHCFSSTFSQYTVVERGFVVKIHPAAPLDKVVLLSCGATTGLGSVWNVAKVEAGATVAIFGLGAVGLGAAEAARVAGASRIIGVDTDNSKSEFGKSFGITDFVNPNDCDKPTEEVIKEMTGSGVDYAFECVGSTKLMTAAFESCHDDWGLAVIAGLAPLSSKMELAPYHLLRGRSIVGSLFGGWSPQTDIPGLVERYLRKEFHVDSLITDTLPLSQINKAIAGMKEPGSLRTVVIL